MPGTAILLHAPVVCPRARQQVRASRRNVMIRASQDTKEAYVPPSMRTSHTELDALQRFSEVVPDVLLSQNLQDVEQPKAATSSRSVLGGILNSPGLRRYKMAIEQARYFDKCSVMAGGDRTSCQIDKALVNVGALFLEKVEGRVSTEVDPKVARDTEKLVQRGRGLIQMYEEVGVPKDRVLLRIPATWEGIQAAKQLEGEGITTHLVLVYSFVQGAAAAQAGVSVIQPNVGRLHDWYNRHPGFIRDPKGPLEESYFGKKSEVNPGLLLVERLYNYAKKYHPKTLVMASGLRTKQEAVSLAGCDFLVIGPKVLESLGRMTTLEGYNDGLSAVSGSQDALDPVLTKQRALEAEFTEEELAVVTEKLFRDNLGQAASELLSEGIRRLEQDADRLEPFLLGLAGGQT